MNWIFKLDELNHRLPKRLFQRWLCDMNELRLNPEMDDPLSHKMHHLTRWRIKTGRLKPPKAVIDRDKLYPTWRDELGS